jgi:hypothetical protein
MLAGLVSDYAAERSRLHGHDRRRLLYLADQLKDPYHPAWTVLPADLAQRGQDALHFLTMPPTPGPGVVRRPTPTLPPLSPASKCQPPTIGL